MGRKLDLSGLTDDEAEHVLKVVQRDMKLRKKEEERLSEMKQELAEEGSRCSILSKQHRFNEHCCIRCCAPFTFLFNPKRQCLDCQFNVCKTCCTYSKRDRAWLCSACQKGRIFRTQSLEWYYNNVKSRFKRFGSAKVLKTLYRKHIIERGTFSDLPESSVNDGSNDNDGSLCGSDSVFYRQSEGHSMAETLTVALRVAEEAIEEAIAKAEEFRDSLEKQNEARYLRDHKEELIEELATTIVQKIIQRRKRSEMQTEYDFVWPQPQSLIQTSELPSPSQPHTSSQDPLKTPYPLWRSRSAFSLTSDDSPVKGPEEEEEAAAAGGGSSLHEYASLKRESKAASLPNWKSMDRLDNSSTSSVLQSPDGNWIALHSSQLSRPSLLTKRKSLVFSVLEKESSVVSAYDEMGSDSEEVDEGGWGAALKQFQRKLSDETYYTDSQHDPEWTYTQHPPVTSPSSGLYTNTETLNSDSEASSVLSACPRKPTHNLSRKKGAPDSHLHPHQQLLYQQHFQQSLSPYLPHTEALDVNFNPKIMGDSSEAEDRQCVRRSRRRRKSKKESSTEQNKPGGQDHAQSIYPLAQENSGFLLNALLKRGLSEEQPGPDSNSAPLIAPDPLKLDAMTVEAGVLDVVAPNSPSPNAAQSSSVAPESEIVYRGSRPGSGSGDHLEEEIRSRISELVSRGNSKDSSSSDEEDKLMEKDNENHRDKPRPKQTEKQRLRTSVKREKESEVMEQVNGQRATRLTKSASVREERRVQERVLEKRAESFVEKVVEKEQKRGEVNRVSKKQRKKDGEKEAAQKGGAKRSGSSASSPAVTPSSQEGGLSNNQVGQNDFEQQQKLQLLSSVIQQQKYSAASLCSITTEVLKVLNATEDLIGEAGGESYTPSESMSASPISSSSDTRRLDQRLTQMEENVYLAAGAVYGLEGALGELEQCARSISRGTTDTELAFLEDQVATAAAQVQQSELKISNIEARISALKTAGLNVTVCNRFSKVKPNSKPETLDSSRHQRRKLPAPPLKEKLESEQQVRP
ncbi:PREDICTED: rab effector MyRIP-like isoform X2 [Cyprinodon variegatus]|uniref:rab effector MyRIP-like isoform X2 n=1 Tax=Cyprinodon variegatus TaxID=28743 RepID=UPI000742686E|nr:PREDICTED: rab effector MyRIP-like isoform X2 [Cyprinodon variegatus]